MPALSIRHQLFIDGRFVDAESGETLATLNPHDNTPIAQVALAGKADVDKAVAAAKRAFPKWSRMAAADRGRILLKLADLIEANGEELARLESLDTGHPIRDSRRLDVPRTAACFRYFGGMADKFQGETIPVEEGFQLQRCASRSASSARWCRGTSRSCSRAGRWRPRWRPATAL